jgi:DNA-binding HxlR family transcriptional regulator
MQLIGGRWKPTILFLLAAQEYRFLALKRAIPGVSLKVFTAQLKALELHGLVKRDQAETRALQVEYSLTPLGQSCIPLLEALEDWGLQHQAELEAVLASGKSALPKNSKV